MSADFPPADRPPDPALPPPDRPLPAVPDRAGWVARAMVLSRALLAGLRSRIGRQVAIAAVAISAFAALGHFVGGLAGWWRAYEVAFGHAEPKAEASAAPPLSIAVLPFSAEGNDDRWLADNLTSDVATELSRLPGSSVLGRESTARFRLADLDPRQAASELKVRYLLLGEAQRNGDKVRLRVRLIEGQTGAQRWADKFDLERGALPQLADDLSLRLARVVDVQLHRSEGQKAARLPPDESSADDLAMQGFGILYGGISPETSRRALVLFEQAVAKDPKSVRGWSGMAMSCMYLHRWAAPDRNHRTCLAQAVAQLQVLDPTGLATLHTSAFLPLSNGDLEGALAGADRLVSHYPGHHAGYTMRATALVRMGRFEEALAATDRSLSLLPNDPDPANKWRRSFIMFALGHYAQAVALSREVVAAAPGLPTGNITLLAALVRNGKADEARQLLARLREKNPDFDYRRGLAVLAGSGERYLAVRADLVAALSELGLQ